MGAFATLIDFIVLAGALVYLSGTYQDNLISDLLDEGRRQFRLMTSEAAASNPYIPLLAVGVVAFAGAVTTSVLGATLARIVFIVMIPIVAVKIAYRASGSALGRVLGRVFSRQEAAQDPDGFQLPVSISDTSGAVSKFAGVVSIPRARSILALGATRSGKTETIKHFIDQMNADADEPVIVYDHKTDFRDHLDQRGIEYVRLTTSGGSARWNLFREIENDRDADEIARAIFPSGSDSGGDSAAFFNTTARQVFAAVVKYLDRELSNPTNGDLVRFFRSNDAADIYEEIGESKYGDLQQAVDALNPDANRQSQGVYSTLQSRILDTFVGEFGAEPSADDLAPEISIREYMKNPERYGVLVLDYPHREGETVQPIFRFLIDHAAMYAIEDGERGAYFILDEFARIPGLRRIDDLVNVGAGQNVQVLLTLQSVSQLYEGYGKERGRAILSGLVTSIILRLGDGESVSYARDVIGTQFAQYTAHVDRERDMLSGEQVETNREVRQSEEHTFAQGDFMNFAPGEGVIVRPDGWVYGQIERPE